VIVPENYVHNESNAVGSSHYGKLQSTLLTAVVYWVEDGEVKHSYFDYVSSYLSHNDYFYGESLQMLLIHLKEEMNLELKRLYIITDGGRHFVSRFAFWYNNIYSQQFGKSILCVFHVIMQVVLFVTGFVPLVMEKGHVMDMVLWLNHKQRPFFA
jgi:hypothetical protein